MLAVYEIGHAATRLPKENYARGVNWEDGLEVENSADTAAGLGVPVRGRERSSRHHRPEEWPKNRRAERDPGRREDYLRDRLGDSDAAALDRRSY